MISELNGKIKNLIFECDKRLIPIFRRSFSKDIKYISDRREVSEKDYDSHVPIDLLPYHFRQNLDSFRNSSPGWLQANSQKADAIRQKFVEKKGKIVGISWLTESNLPLSCHRNIKLEELAEPLKQFELALVNLQYGDVSGQITSLGFNHGIDVLKIPDLDLFNDIDGLAAAISACDFIVSIDNLTVHLAGALGVDTKVLLPYVPDERWGLGTTESYWYKSLALYRQTKRGDWHEALRQLKNDLKFALQNRK
jgi:ADP-heptose:LPS heptosyltransferase